MDLEQTLQTCSKSQEPNTPSESLEYTVGNPERSDSSANTTALALGTQHHNGFQAASLNITSDTINEDTNEKHITTNSLENCSQSVDGKAEIVSDLTPNILDSDIEPNSSVSRVPSSESPSGELNLLSAVEFTPRVLTTIDMHTEEECFPSPVDLDIPSSSPPSSSPTSGYIPSSSPIPMASSPCGYDLTPPTSPAKTTDGSKVVNIQVDKIKEIPEIKFYRSEIDSEETVGRYDETTVIGEYEPICPEENLAAISKNEDDAHLTDHGITPREKVFQNLMPGPKRATLAGQKVRLQKLSRPFRPPAVQKPVAIINQEEITASGHDKLNACYKPAADTSSFARKIQEKMKNRTAKAAAQFKSPLSSTGSEAGPLVRPTPTIQALERTLQLLKRAVKVKEESEEEVLSGLIQKWTEAGREIAWEVWGLVKENSDGGNKAGKKRPIEDSWGWQDSGDSKRRKGEERLWGWDVVPVYEREAEQEQCEVEEGARCTMGTMLMEMGIAAETFGWNAEEERFE